MGPRVGSPCGTSEATGNSPAGSKGSVTLTPASSTQDPKMATYQVVELRILTNWGHPEYTCIYRFRVHGEPTH